MIDFEKVIWCSILWRGQAGRLWSEVGGDLRSGGRWGGRFRSRGLSSGRAATWPRWASSRLAATASGRCHALKDRHAQPCFPVSPMVTLTLTTCCTRDRKLTRGLRPCSRHAAPALPLDVSKECFVVRALVELLAQPPRRLGGEVRSLRQATTRWTEDLGDAEEGLGLVAATRRFFGRKS